LCRPNFTTNGSPAFAIDLNLDFSNINPTNIPTTPTLSVGVWDVSKWDSADWADEVVNQSWTTVFGIGDCASPTIRGSTKAITLSFTAYDMVWQQGGAL
jgi:hypothetical protein